jgi:hypothetical protein
MTAIKYTGIVIADKKKIEKEIKQLKDRKKVLMKRIQFALGAGFDTTEYEEELNTISMKLKVYDTIY